MLLVVVALWRGGGDSFFQINRLLGTAADVGQSGGRVLTTVLDTGVNVTSTVTHFAVALATTGLAVSDELWHGVDLLNVTVRSQSGRLVFDDPGELDRFLSTVQGLEAFNVTDGVRASLVGAAGGLSLAVPHIESSVVQNVIVGAFDQLVIEARLLPSGYLGIAFRWAVVCYLPAWCNPFWEAWESDTAAELEQINTRLAKLLLDLPDIGPPTLPLNEETLASSRLPPLVFARMRRVRRAASLLAGRVLEYLWFPVVEW